MVGNSSTEESVDNGLNYSLGYDMSMMSDEVVCVCSSSDYRVVCQSATVAMG